MAENNVHVFDQASSSYINKLTNGKNEERKNNRRTEKRKNV